MKDGKLESVEELRAWLDRKPPPREQDLEVANRPPEEWPATDRPAIAPAAAEVAPGTTNAPQVEPGCPFDEQFEADK